MYHRYSVYHYLAIEDAIPSAIVCVRNKLLQGKYYILRGNLSLPRLASYQLTRPPDSLMLN